MGRAAVGNDGATGALLLSQVHFVLPATNTGTFGPISEMISIEDSTGAPANEYKPGATYTITVTVTENSGTPSGYGFQLVAVDDDVLLNNAGIWQNLGSNVQESIAGLAGGRTYIGTWWWNQCFQHLYSRLGCPSSRYWQCHLLLHW